jgi:PAS domain S-box-containing protein
MSMEGESLDWRSLAWLIAERAPHPLLVLDRSGEVRLVTSSASEALGWPHGDLQGRSCWQTLAPAGRNEAGRCRLEQAFDGVIDRMKVEVRAANDRRLEVSCDCMTVGEQAERCLVVAIRSVGEVSASGTRAQNEITYEVSLKPAERGRLLTPPQGQHREYGAASQLCFEAIHGASSPCVDCPLFRPTEEPWPRMAVRRVAASGVYHLLQARQVNDDLALVTVNVLPDASLPALNEANLRHVGEKAGLTERERSVVRHLLLGCSADEIAKRLGITSRTVKFHQQNALNKLGADSRIDLFRLFFNLATTAAS